MNSPKADAVLFRRVFFAWTAVLVVFQWVMSGVSAAKVVFVLSTLCGLNLFVLWKVSQALVFSSTQGGRVLSVIFWLTAKFFSIGLIGFAFYSFRFSSLSVLIMGLGTVIVVPLVGGVFVALRKEL